jgi:hypothetical protein
MSTKQNFELTVRKEDLLELYRDQMEFKLFSKEYAGRLFFIAVAFILGSITLIAAFYNSKYLFYALLFMAGIAYCVNDIQKSYRTKNNKKETIEAWATEVLAFKQHQLFVSEQAITYHRDEEVFTYPFDNTHTHDAPVYFQLLSGDGSELLIPKKAFLDHEYEQFLEAIHAITKNK